ncbi:MAG TPA: histidine kinase, partial [Bacteroidetes bacterium]|nr:histidine kinase [Bacteroidota bacterium]
MTLRQSFLRLSNGMIAVVVRQLFPIYRLPSLLVLFAAHVLAGQQVHTLDMKLNRLSVEQGLSQSTVNAIMEDIHGLMWFGTQDGLNMYDGYSFTVFKHDPADTNSISDNWITSLCQDSEGNIWVGTLEGGLNLYPANRDRFIHFRNDSGNPSSHSGNNVVTIYQDATGTIWVGVWGGGLNRYESQTNSFSHFRAEKNNANSLSGNEVYCICEDAGGVLWIGTWNGLTSFDKTRKSFKRYLSTVDAAGQSKGEKIAGLFEGSDGTLWIGTQDHGLMVYDRKNDRVTPCVQPTTSLLHTTPVWALCGGSNGSVWIATAGNGVVHLDPVLGTTTQYANDPSDPKSLFNNSVLRIFSDSRDIIWIGTEGGGITMLNQQQRRFRHYYHRQRDPHSLSHDHVRSIVEDAQGNLWIGTEGGGLNHFNVSTRQFFSDRNGSFNTADNKTVFSLYQERMGDLWIGTDTGVRRYTHKSGRVLRVPLGVGAGGKQRLTNVTAITGEERGKLWFGTYGDGLCQYEPSTGECVWFHRKVGDTTSLNGDWVLSLLIDTKGELWVGTWGTGLGRFNRSNGTFRRYRNDRTNPNSLSNNTINCLAESHDGALWVGTSAGLNRFDASSERFVSYSEKDGLPNGVINGIIEDDERNLWLSTNNGIAKFNPRTKQCRSFDVSDGLQGNEFNNGAFCRTKNGQFYFGGTNGLTEFNPGEIRDDSSVPSIVLTSFKIFDKPARLPRSISFTDSIELSYVENFFSFEFVAVNYLNPSKTRYAYMMEGFDRDWVQAGTRRYASYTHLDPGNYVFRVRASNSDGVWDMNGAAVQIHILPPLWQTWWFRLGVG